MRLRTLSRGLFLALGLSGCAAMSDGPGGGAPGTLPPATGDLAVQRIDENLARLQALDVVWVGSLVLDVPAEAFQCYGACPEWADEIAAAREVAAERLDELVPIVEAAAATPVAGACAAETIEQNLAALRGLEIIEVNGLIEEQPANDPRCYNLPCPEDVERAQAITCGRAEKLAAIASACNDYE